jgi:hypothetical protein
LSPRVQRAAPLLATLLAPLLATLLAFLLRARALLQPWRLRAATPPPPLPLLAPVLLLLLPARVRVELLVREQLLRERVRPSAPALRLLPSHPTTSSPSPAPVWMLSAFFLKASMLSRHRIRRSRPSSTPGVTTRLSPLPSSPLGLQLLRARLVSALPPSPGSASGMRPMP